MVRGQAAMEFLSTYGWAIMVSLVAIGGLSYFGVTSPQELIPEKCLFQQELTCKDFGAFYNPVSGNASVVFYVQNNVGNPITIAADSVVVELMNPMIESDPCPAADLVLGSAGVGEISCDFPIGFSAGSVGEKFRFSISAQYMDVGGRYPHAVSGEIFTQLQ